MKQKKTVSLSVVLIAIVAAATFCTINNTTNAQTNSPSTSQNPDNNTFYVGVTYCGNSVSEAKQLIDKVKNYTNLFVLDSGQLQSDGAAVNQTGDYAVASGMYFMVYLGINSVALADNWLSTYDGRWGDYFLGIYMIDEPGGKMLDGGTYLINSETGRGISKTADGTIRSAINGTPVNFMRNGTIIAEAPSESYYDETVYYPNGTITAQYRNGTQISPINASRVPFTSDGYGMLAPSKTTLTPQNSS